MALHACTIPGTRHVLLALYAVFIVHGTLFPLTGWHYPAHGLHLTGFTLLSVPDIVQNLLLYAPLGGLFAADFKGWHWPGRIGGALFFSLALSLTLETLQNFLPYRVPALSDVVFNTLGGLGGALCAWALLGNNPVAREIARVLNAHCSPDVLAGLGLASAGLWAAANLSPFLPALNVPTILNGLAPLRALAKGHAGFDFLEFGTAALRVSGLGLLLTSLYPGLLRVIIPFGALLFAVAVGKILVHGQQLSFEFLAGCALGWGMAGFFTLAMSPRFRLWLAAATIAVGLSLGADGALHAAWPCFALGHVTYLAWPGSHRAVFILGGLVCAGLAALVSWQEEYVAAAVFGWCGFWLLAERLPRR